MSPIQDTPEGALLTVRIQPKASRTELVGVHGEALKIRVTAPPVDGAANEALCQYLAERCGLPTQAVSIQVGLAARLKRVLVRGVSAQRVRTILGV